MGCLALSLPPSDLIYLLAAHRFSYKKQPFFPSLWRDHRRSARNLSGVPAAAGNTSQRFSLVAVLPAPAPGKQRAHPWLREGSVGAGQLCPHPAAGEGGRFPTPTQLENVPFWGRGHGSPEQCGSVQSWAGRRQAGSRQGTRMDPTEAPQPIPVGWCCCWPPRAAPAVLQAGAGGPRWRGPFAIESFLLGTLQGQPL